MKKFNENHLFILKSLVVFIVFYLFLSFTQSAVKTAQAAVANSARIIPFQGTLTNSTGANVADGNYSLTFKIYTVTTGGTAAWSETQSSVAVTSGAFSVLIGSTDANGVNMDMSTPPYYLGITVGTNAEMSPRIQLGMTPWAINSWAETGLIAYFNLTACPTGWTEFTSARGMYIVGLPSGGTLAGTSGTALTNLESRAVGQHSHTYSGTTSADGSHTHSISDPGHSHSTYTMRDTGEVGPYFARTAYWYTTGAYLNTSGASTGISISASATHTHTLSGTTANSGSTAGTNAPYIQLLVCQKN